MTPPQDRILPGVALMLGFCLVAPVIDVSAKLASATVPVGQITLARFLVQLALMLPLVLLLGHGLRMSRRAFALVVARAAAGILSTFTFVWAVSVMPVADALAIAFVEPFILLLLGWLLFGDHVGPRRILASAVGFCGALLVIQPSLMAFGWVALMPLGTALAFALYMLITRALSRHMHPVPMQLHTAWIAAAMCLPIIGLGAAAGIGPLDPVWPQGIVWLWLFGVGAAATVSHMFMTYALRFAPSATLAPLHYLEIVSAVALGYLVFSDFPNAMTWAGIATICASGLYIIHRERVTARAIRATARPAPPQAARAAE